MHTHTHTHTHTTRRNAKANNRGTHAHALARTTHRHTRQMFLLAHRFHVPPVTSLFIACPPCHVPFLVTLPDLHPRRFLRHLASCFSSRPHLLHHRHLPCNVPCHLYHVPFRLVSSAPCYVLAILRPPSCQIPFMHALAPLPASPHVPLSSSHPSISSISRPHFTFPTCRVPLLVPHVPFRVTRPSHPLVTSPYSARGAGLGRRPPPRPARGPWRRRRPGALVTSPFKNALF